MAKPTAKKTVPSKNQAKKKPDKKPAKTAKVPAKKKTLEKKRDVGRPLKYPCGTLEDEEYFVRSDLIKILGVSDAMFNRYEIKYSAMRGRAKLYKFSEVIVHFRDAAKVKGVDNKKEFTDSAGETFTLEREKAMSARADRISKDLKNQTALEQLLPRSEFTKVCHKIVETVVDGIGQLHLDIKREDPDIPAGTLSLVEKKVAQLRNKLSLIRPFKEDK